MLTVPNQCSTNVMHNVELLFPSLSLYYFVEVFIHFFCCYKKFGEHSLGSRFPPVSTILIVYFSLFDSVLDASNFSILLVVS